MGFMDAFTPETTIELKVSVLSEIIKEAAEHRAVANHLLNGVKNEVPHKYIREVITGEKEEKDTEIDPVIASANVEINASEFAQTIKKVMLDGVTGKNKEEPTLNKGYTSPPPLPNEDELFKDLKFEIYPKLINYAIRIGVSGITRATNINRYALIDRIILREREIAYCEKDTV